MNGSDLCSAMSLVGSRLEPFAEETLLLSHVLLGPLLPMCKEPSIELGFLSADQILIGLVPLWLNKMAIGGGCGHHLDAAQGWGVGSATHDGVLDNRAIPVVLSVDYS